MLMLRLRNASHKHMIHGGGGQEAKMPRGRAVPVDVGLLHQQDDIEEHQAVSKLLFSGKAFQGKMGRGDTRQGGEG